MSLRIQISRMCVDKSCRIIPLMPRERLRMECCVFSCIPVLVVPEHVRKEKGTATIFRPNVCCNIVACSYMCVSMPHFS